MGFTNIFKGGSSYPGKLALKIDPKILDTLAKDYEIVVVTGTNGKTLTTALTVNILRQEFDEVLTNPTVLTWSKELSLLFKCQGEKRTKEICGVRN